MTKKSEAGKKKTPDPTVNAVRSLAEETARLADGIEKQNAPFHRFLLGLVFGIGTAIGASVVASILIFVLSQVIARVTQEPILDQNEAEKMLEQTFEGTN